MVYATLTRPSHPVGTVAVRGPAIFSAGTNHSGFPDRAAAPLTLTHSVFGSGDRPDSALRVAGLGSRRRAAG